MKVLYTPEDGNSRAWDFDPRKVRASKAEMIERRAETGYEQWVNDVRKGATRAKRVLLWHLFTVDHPAFRWEDLPDFFTSELKIELVKSELVELREGLASARGVSEADKAKTLELLDAQIADTPDDAPNFQAALPTSDPATGA